MGRFDFGLYEAVDAAGEVVCLGEAYFPKRRAREWHKTEGFREEALCLEPAQLPCQCGASEPVSASVAGRHARDDTAG